MSESKNCLYCSDESLMDDDIILSNIPAHDILTVESLNDHLLKPKTWIVGGRKTSHALYLALKNRNKVKRLILLHPQPFFEESLASKIINTVENLLTFLPQGLPFRTASHENDPHPYLHLIRVPILIICSQGNSYAQKLGERLPVALVTDGRSKSEIDEFMHVSARLPMRRVLRTQAE